MTPCTPRCRITSLYRTYLRQIKQLPDLYLRQFFRLKVVDDVQTILISKDDGFRKVKRFSKDLRKLEAANSGSTDAFAHILDLAYGRKGKLKWEIMEPILCHPDVPIPPRILHSMERSRPPVYSPELKALLTSGASRSTKALKLKQLDHPPMLPARADPSSEDAKYLGPLSKRRETNVRWRFFATQWRKVLPPLQVVVKDLSSNIAHNTKEDLLRAGIRGFGMQGHGVSEEIEALVGPPSRPKAPTCKERRITDASSESSHTSHQRHPSRWLRRRYQELLGRLPILSYSARYASTTLAGYSISLSPNAVAPSLRYSASRFPKICSIDKVWLQLASTGRDRAGVPSGKQPSTRL